MTSIEAEDVGRTSVGAGCGALTVCSDDGGRARDTDADAELCKCSGVACEFCGLDEAAARVLEYVSRADIAQARVFLECADNDVRSADINGHAELIASSSIVCKNLVDLNPCRTVKLEHIRRASAVACPGIVARCGDHRQVAVDRNSRAEQIASTGIVWSECRQQIPRGTAALEDLSCTGISPCRRVSAGGTDNHQIAGDINRLTELVAGTTTRGQQVRSLCDSTQEQPGFQWLHTMPGDGERITSQGVFNVSIASAKTAALGCICHDSGTP